MVFYLLKFGQVGFYVDGAINWDIAALVGAFGLTLLLSQVLSSQGMPANPENLQKILDQQLLAKNEVVTTSASTISDKRLPFEPNSKK